MTRRRPVGWAGIVVALACLCGCASDDRPAGDSAEARIEACRADPTSRCCAPEDCGPEQVCDFSFICGLTPDGVTCGEAGGDRVCLDRCGAGDSCPTDRTCEQLELFYASDAGEMIPVCR